MRINKDKSEVNALLFLLKIICVNIFTINLKMNITLDKHLNYSLKIYIHP